MLSTTECADEFQNNALWLWDTFYNCSMPFEVLAQNMNIGHIWEKILHY